MIAGLWQSKELKNSCFSLYDTKGIRFIIYGCVDRVVFIVMYPVDVGRVAQSV